MNVKRLVKYIDSSTHTSTVIVFPGVGSTAYFCAQWAKFLPEDMNLYAVEYSGHGRRSKEEPLKSFDELKRDLITTVEPFLNQDLFFIGHSLGGILAYEMASWIQETTQKPVKGIFALSCTAPQAFNSKMGIDLNEEDILKFLRQLSDLPEEILTSQIFLKNYLPTIRADLEVVGSYQWNPNRSLLKCPVHILWGNEDPLCIQNEMKNWEILSSHSSHFQEYSGNHTFMDKSPELVLGWISAQLSRLVKEDRSFLVNVVIESQIEYLRQ